MIMDSSRSRIALFAGQSDEYYQSRFIEGFIKRSFENDMDVCVFSTYRKYQDTPEREMGDTNILKLADPKAFEGIVIMKDTIQNTEAMESLEKRIHGSFDGPVLVIDAKSEFYPSVFMDGYESVRMLTKHLIETHKVTDIGFLSGKKWHKHSKDRQKGFIDEMEEHGLSVPDHRIIEGDFWYKSGERCVDYLTTDSHKLPEAILCANDQMAIGVCKALENKGIRVPEDIIVVGSDSSMEGQTSPKSITSYLTPAEEYGRYALDWLLSEMKGNKPEEFNERSILIAGESCGCCDASMPSFSQKRKAWDTEISKEGYDSVNNTMFENLMLQNDLQDYISTVYSYAYQIEDAESFHLCLVNNIKYLLNESNAYSNNDGYPDKMYYAIRYNNSRISNIASFDDCFDSKKMLPDLYEKRDFPVSFFFTPVFFEDINFGYAVVCYSKHIGAYDEKYRRWIGTVSRGFEMLRRNMLIHELQERLDKFKSGKFENATGEYENLSDEEKKDYETVKEILDDNLLTYYFQPIVSAKDGNIYSYEALMRSNTERRISPLTIIKYAAMMGRLADVESATFNNILDILDIDKKTNKAKIFINSIPGVKISNRESIEERLSQRSDTIVVELTEEAQISDEQLNTLKEFYGKLNIEIAIDDYGTGYSNISNLLSYMPDYVKIDRSLLSDIQNKPQKQHFVREIIEFCHDNDIKALAEGVETVEELRTVIHLGTDLIQGYYTAKPAPGFIEKIDDNIVEEINIFQQEKSDGKAKRTYIAGKTNRISLLTLVKDECSDIVIGQGEMVYKDITIVGTPSMKTNISVRIESGYNGRLTLENAYFANVQDRPCISIGENSDVVCIIEGDNVLKGCGIRVPASSRFNLTGNGNLTIEAKNNQYYGIGNDINSEHGEIIIEPVGKLMINGRGNCGTLIGSGEGGKIFINGGSIELTANGDECVAVGSLNGSDEIKILNCRMETDISVSDGVGSGSLNNNANVRIYKSYVKYYINGNHISAIGTLLGSKANVNILDSLAEFNIRSSDSTCIGAMNGSSELSFSVATLRIENVGKTAFAFGGITSDTVAEFNSVDTKVKIYNSIGKETNAKDENITMVNGKCVISVNDVEIKRNLIYRFDN